MKHLPVLIRGTGVPNQSVYVAVLMLDRIGPETCLWSSDYPHQESTFGYTRSSIQAVFDATSVENAQMIVGKTALELFRME